MKPYKIFYPILISISLFYFSCSKDKGNSNNSNNISSPASQCPALSGITTKNENAENTGIIDTADWRMDDHWNQCEKDLFGGGNFNLCTTNDTLLGTIVYPNPCSSYYTASFGFVISPLYPDTNLTKRVKVDLVIVNQHFKNLFTLHTDNNFLGSKRFLLYPLDTDLNDTIFRLYYKITDTTGCVRMGHGDVIRR